MKQPMNDLERAFALAARGPEGHPEFFRQLRVSQLAFLTVGRFAGKVEASAFTVWTQKNEMFIPIFTSTERAVQALKATGRWKNRPDIVQMTGEKLFKIIIR